MNLSRLLFVTCMPLETPRSASMAFMGLLLEKYPDFFAWYALHQPASGTVNPFDIPYASSRPPSRPSRLPRLKQFIHYFPWAWYQGHKAAVFGRAHQVNAVLADLAFESVVAGRVAAQALDVPLLVMVHDDPVNRIRIKHNSHWLVGLYKCEFIRTLHAARRCAVISDYMGEVYQERYGVETLTLFPGVETGKCLPPHMLDPQKSPIIIGSVGSVISPENWNTLLEAIQLLNQRHGAGKLRLLHLGALPENLQLSDDVETTGWLPESDFVRQLERFDMGFLNWGFSPEMAETRRMSFPLKTSSYIQAQVPMLALGPSDSSVVNFVQDYKCGIACTKPSPVELATQLETLLFKECNYQESLKGVERLKGIFSRQQFFKNFEAFVSIS